MSPVITALIYWLFQGIGVLASYVTNSSVFPKPLTPDQERDLLIKKEAGDESARNSLIERNLRLVAHIVKKFDNTGEDSEDLISIGTIGLIKAINTFNPDKKTRLATYAARCIENEILMQLRATKRSRNELMLYDTIGSDREGNEINLIDILRAEDDDVVELVQLKIDQTQLLKKIGCLSDREKLVLELRYGLGNYERQTQRQISRLLGISRSYVSRIEKRAISKLQGEMC